MQSACAIKYSAFIKIHVCLPNSDKFVMIKLDGSGSKSKEKSSTYTIKKNIHKLAPAAAAQ